MPPCSAIGIPHPADRHALADRGFDASFGQAPGRPKPAEADRLPFQNRVEQLAAYVCLWYICELAPVTSRVGNPCEGACVTGDESKFRARIEAAQSDASALKELTKELQALDAPWVRSVQTRLMAARFKLYRPPLATPPALVTKVPPNSLVRFGLPFPDGRPLYRYRLGHTAFVALGEHLRTRAAIMRFQVIDSDAALFVIWSAEWFRRIYEGGGEEWASLGAGIGLICEQAQWRALADRGLKYWKIPALKLSNTHHRLVPLVIHNVG